MTTSEKGRIPRWLTAVFMFVVSFLLVLPTFVFDIMGELYYYITILIALVLWIYVDKQPPDAIGFRFEERWWLHIILGVSAGGIVIGLIIWLEVVLGWVILTPIFVTQSIGIIVGLLAYYATWQAIVACAEELVTRGYVQQNLATQLATPMAIFASASMFALHHVPKILWKALPPLNAGILFCNMILAGIWLGLAFARTRTLWLPVGLHFGWNYMVSHLVGFGDYGLHQVQNIGPEVLTGGSIGPEAGLVGTLAFIFLIGIVWVWTKSAEGNLIRTFERKPLLLFLFGFLVTGIPAIIGIWVSGLGIFLLIWLVYAVIFLQIWENKILCSHCPYYATEGRTLRCHANYGLFKLWRYNPEPMNRSEQIQIVVGVVVFIAFPFPLLVLVQQWFFLILTALGAVILAAILFGWLCLRCVNFSCPFNRVPKIEVDSFLKQNPEMRKAWEAKGFRIDSTPEEPD